VQICRMLHYGHNRGCILSLGRHAGVSFLLFTALAFFVMGDHRAKAHGACPLPLSLLLITCSAEKKVDRTEICIEEKKKICYASACVDSCTNSGKTTALALATKCGSSRTPALTSFLFLHFSNSSYQPSSFLWVVVGVVCVIWHAGVFHCVSLLSPFALLRNSPTANSTFYFYRYLTHIARNIAYRTAALKLTLALAHISRISLQAIFKNKKQ
jgi:hypothetical protein